MRLKSLLAIIMLFICSLAFASVAPEDMLKQTTDEMLTALKQSPNRNTDTLYQIVTKVLIPHIDLDNMSRMVVGSTFWDQATPAQQAEFKQQFTHYVTQTYSGALSAYQDQTVKYFPVRGGTAGKTRVQVSSEIDQSNGQSVPVSYKLALTNGEWRVYDFSVEGISMVENYRAQFTDVLRQQGFAGLLKQLESRNKSNQ